MEWRRRVEEYLRLGIEAADPERLVSTALDRLGPRLGPRLRAIAVGKAAAAMVRGAVAVLGDRVSGLIIAPGPVDIPGFDTLVGDHPIPGTGSFDAGRRALAEAEAAGEGETLLVLLSGGASALMEHPAPGVDPSDIVALTARLLASGQPIEVVNAERGRMSLLKDGGLTAVARPARVVTLALSDVGDDPESVVGGGPTRGGDEFVVLADGSTIADQVARRMESDGFRPERVRLSGAAATTGSDLARRVLSLPIGAGLVGHGETTVHVTGDGRGGPNQELALAAAIGIQGMSATFGSVGTDGVDGYTTNAGAIVDGTTVARGRALSLDAAAHLASNDSAGFLEAVGDVIITGPTGTNVADLLVAIRW